MSDEEKKPWCCNPDCGQDAEFGMRGEEEDKGRPDGGIDLCGKCLPEFIAPGEVYYVWTIGTG